MTRISDEEMEKIREVDLYSFLESYNPHELRFVGYHQGAEAYTTMTHDSMIISNGMWIRNSTGQAGRSALDYLIKVENIPFRDAAEMIRGGIAYNPGANSVSRYRKREAHEAPKAISVPERSKSGGPEMLRYLCEERGLDRSLVESLVKKGDIYPNRHKQFINVVFIGRDKEGNVKYAFRRGTQDGEYKREAAGSDKSYGFRVSFGQDDGSVHVFEGAIDLLSYLTLIKANGGAYDNFRGLALSGVTGTTRGETVSSLPAALGRYLNENSSTSKVFLHLDADEAGSRAAKTIRMTLLECSPSMDVILSPPPGGYKDFNEALIGAFTPREKTAPVGLIRSPDTDLRLREKKASTLKKFTKENEY